jgi:hypothetical protein
MFITPFCYLGKVGCVSFFDEPVFHIFRSLFLNTFLFTFSRRKIDVFYYLDEKPAPHICIDVCF